MKRLLLVCAVAAVMIAMAAPQAYAKDEFEDGFKHEMGAIAARATVGLGLGVVHGVAHGGHHYGHGHYRHAEYDGHGHKHGRKHGHKHKHCSHGHCHYY